MLRNRLAGALEKHSRSDACGSFLQSNQAYCAATCTCPLIPIHSGILPMLHMQSGIPIGGIMGTSAGAFTGSLYCAGYSPKEVGTSCACVAASVSTAAQRVTDVTAWQLLLTYI
jgi:hypothetical protein